MPKCSSNHLSTKETITTILKPHLDQAIKSLLDAFNWVESEEGGAYWEAVYDKLCKIRADAKAPKGILISEDNLARLLTEASARGYNTFADRQGSELGHKDYAKNVVERVIRTGEGGAKVVPLEGEKLDG